MLCKKKFFLQKGEQKRNYCVDCQKKAYPNVRE